MYEISALYWYRFIFMAELLFAEGIIVYRLKRRRKFALWLALALAVCVGLTFAVPVIKDTLWGSVMFLMLFGITVVALKIAFAERWIKILFCAVAAYTLQHIAYELFDFFAIIMGFANVENVQGSGAYGFWIIYGSTGTSFVSANPFTIMMYLFIYGLTYFFGYLFINKRLNGRDDFGVDNIKTFVLAAIILFFDIVISSVISYYSLLDFNHVYIALLDLFNTFCCVFAIYLQFDVDDRYKLQNDLFIIKRLWKEKEEQYNVIKENIELINQKCHDLKHQIHRIGDEGRLDGEVVKEIEDVISIYDSTVKTGNEALDIILTEKSLYCSKHDIKLCCIIDGEKLSFMKSADLYALFGNLIDNAIEAVERLDSGKRTISLSVKQINSFLTVNIHNWYEKEISFIDNLPKTTKSDTSMHGYGMKSVQMICRNYGGEMSINTENKVFNLNIVFPLNGLRS